MRLLPSFSSCFAYVLLGAVLLTSAALAAEGRQVRIVRIQGEGATVTVNGASRPASLNMALEPNAVITTTNQEVYVEVETGIVATVAGNSTVAVGVLNASDVQLELRSGQVISQIDKNRAGKARYGVKTGKGVAAARGTSYSVTVNGEATTILTTADTVEFTSPSGGRVVIQAGMVSFTPPGATQPLDAVPLAQAAASNPEVSALLTNAVTAASTVVQNNLGNISGGAAADILTQVVAVASAANPAQAASYTATAVAAATAPGSATSGSAGVTAGAITAAAVAAVPAQAAQIAGAAAGAAPNHAGVITAAAQQVAPAAADAITEQVADTTGQSPANVQQNANANAAQATEAVNNARESTSNVVSPGPGPDAPPPGAQNSGDSESQTTTTDQSPSTPVDPAIGVSPAG